MTDTDDDLSGIYATQEVHLVVQIPLPETLITEAKVIIGGTALIVAKYGNTTSYHVITSPGYPALDTKYPTYEEALGAAKTEAYLREQKRLFYVALNDSLDAS